MKPSTKIKSRYALKNQEAGAMIILAYLSILMFLFLTVLMLDVPYIEKVGRSAQSAVDTAALAGAIELRKRNAVLADTSPDFTTRLQGWRGAKRVVFAALKNNPIAGAESLSINTDNPVKISTDEDNDTSMHGGYDPSTVFILDPLDQTAYGYEDYVFGGDNDSDLRATLNITRGVYQRPTNISGSLSTQRTFYKTEASPNLIKYGTSPAATRWFYADPISEEPNPVTEVRCIAFTSPDNASQNTPTACLPEATTASATVNSGQPLVSVADSIRITITIENVPTLFSKLIGISYLEVISRTATSVPQ